MGKMSLCSVLSSLYWLQFILCDVHISLYHGQISLCAVLSSLYWMQLISCGVHISLYHRQKVALFCAFIIILVAFHIM